ncbi:TraX family protein [Pseudomonas sp. BBP2017]|uniref:TraX family protein n=1 Tax=Pseudomonas sp. BBP2017 TaxID=2109731 RepID=UPI000D134094|nr:TraX family protein [Pseudomonas sp. BBP2017]PSS57312.1 conjugal transfer protein TraX [Pseudomonas sp. BBP2017]
MSAYEPTVSLSRHRNAGQDLIKWLAMITMVIDHLRLVWPEMGDLFIVGRLAFPLFCVAIAANVARTRPGELLTATNSRYIILMIVFAIISEVPYRYISASGLFNVLVTLTFGLLITWGIHHRTWLAGATAITAGVLAYLLDDTLMYGFYGVLVPAAVLIAIKRPGILWLLPALLCVLINTRSSIVAKALDLDPPSILALGAAFAAPLLGLWLLRQSLHFNVQPVRQWGYWFYPAHLVALQALRLCL